MKKSASFPHHHGVHHAVGSKRLTLVPGHILHSIKSASRSFEKIARKDDTKQLKVSKHRVRFGHFAERASNFAASPGAFVFALVSIVVWIAVGPFFHFASRWENIIMEVPAVVTFLLVFLIQNSQGREMMAVQLKLNELIRATDGAHGMMLNLEKLTADELGVLCKQYEILAQEARKRMKRGENDAAVVDMPGTAEALRKISEGHADDPREIEAQDLGITSFM